MEDGAGDDTGKALYCGEVCGTGEVSTRGEGVLS